MFNKGDLIVYSGHGICKIEDICDINIAGNTKAYYVLQPLNNDHQLTIRTPVDNNKVTMSSLMQKDQAEEILDSFQFPGANWIENNHLRIQTYNNIVKSGNRREIAKIANTLIRKKHELELKDRKISEQDKQLLTSIKSVLFKEMALSLHTTYETISNEVNKLLLNKTEEQIELN
ncbi:CarD family transcriptional regulator [Neobacillus sp. YIM B02564]|uniref:CarD family transcriptional regulator n=1 Tax=Neobacillus paridis TaxID=2803862 RepID=A0ABS1TW88_9BACI|nr:CarD family transcriptional regulator [Neobacillus paridis]MBL4954823.1 CarD family transcriptional regulator [Neobacillus paridis]